MVKMLISTRFAKKMIYITPEETVRQHVISYLLDELKVPENMLRVEEPLKHYGIKSDGRADIIINAHYEKENIDCPVAVIECKAPEIFLDEKSFNQVADYADNLNCDYCVLTNGEENFYYYFDENKNDYVQIDELPSYEKLLQGKYTLVDIGEVPPRIKFDELEEFYLNYVDSGDIGENTPKNLAIPMTNFYEGVLDLTHKLPEKNYKIFKLIEDYGIRLLSVGDSSDGTFFGSCRSFIVEYNGDTKFISIATHCYSKEKTALCVGIDLDSGITHHSLQLNVDDNAEVVGNKIKFFHSGRISKGKSSLKIDGLRELVAEKYPEIIDGKKFYLGTLTHDRLWYLDDAEVMQVMENLISYALIRDDYRAMF